MGLTYINGVPLQVASPVFRHRIVVEQGPALVTRQIGSRQDDGLWTFVLDRDFTEMHKNFKSGYSQNP